MMHPTIDKLLDEVDHQLIDRDNLILMFVKWFADEDILKMLKANEWKPTNEEDT